MSNEIKETSKDNAPSVAEFERRVKIKAQELKKRKKPVLGSNEPVGQINKTQLDY